MTISNIEDVKQLVRASGCVGANYIEANESLSKKDFAFRIKICKKEAKESGYWIRYLFFVFWCLFVICFLFFKVLINYHL